MADFFRCRDEELELAAILGQHRLVAAIPLVR